MRAVEQFAEEAEAGWAAAAKDENLLAGHSLCENGDWIVGGIGLCGLRGLYLVAVVLRALLSRARPDEMCLIPFLDICQAYNLLFWRRSLLLHFLCSISRVLDLVGEEPCLS